MFLLLLNLFFFIYIFIVAVLQIRQTLSSQLIMNLNKTHLTKKFSPKKIKPGVNTCFSLLLLTPPPPH